MRYIKEKVKILQCNLPTLNGRIYLKEEVELVLTKIQEPVWGLFGGTSELNIPLDKIAFSATNFLINEQDELVANIKILDTPMGRIMKPLLDLCDYTTVGTGLVSNENVISDFRLLSISAYPKSTHSQ